MSEPQTDRQNDDASAQAGQFDQSDSGADSWEARVLSRITARINELAPELDHFGWESRSLLLLRQRLALGTK